jgi:sporulation protein YlmC with PRC-barrel domain
MLRSLKDIEGYVVNARDGDIGKVDDFLWDDLRWVVRYLVVGTGDSIFEDRRQVLISPIFFRDAEWATRQFHLELTTEKVKLSPPIDLHRSVSRQHEQDFNRHYGNPNYWEYSAFWGMRTYPAGMSTKQWNEAEALKLKQPAEDSHLRSDKEIRGYHIEGTDGEIGHIKDCIVDDETWRIRYLVVNTSNWGLGKDVLIAPHWAPRISWEERKIFVDLSRQKIKDSPTWNPENAVNREYESRLYDYYGRPADWSTGGFAESARPENR